MCSNNENNINELQSIDKDQKNVITVQREELAVSSSCCQKLHLAEVLKRGLNTNSSHFEVNLADQANS
ncbi:hypothetical protein BpHYR1_046853 [Brachionus plicatilis]|uniref:Uncharacterized protein n=1 Tax=Brachionus plicatilis TaxID=10195 RepID=A0A3M7T8C7_BRAPC|nr:hypothetical protein BpHYR1_046853 [Brachionus plicatilis]